MKQICILFVLVIIFSSCVKVRERDYYIPSTYTGYIFIIYNCAGKLNSQNDPDHLRLHIPSDGILCTSAQYHPNSDYRLRYFLVDQENNEIEISGLSPDEQKGSKRQIVDHKIIQTTRNDSSEDDMIKCNIVYERFYVGCCFEWDSISSYHNYPESPAIKAKIEALLDSNICK